MHENGASFAQDRWLIVKADFDNYVIDMIVSPQGFVAGRMGTGNQLVIVPVAWIVTPAVTFFESSAGELGVRTRKPV